MANHDLQILTPEVEINGGNGSARMLQAAIANGFILGIRKLEEAGLGNVAQIMAKAQKSAVDSLNSGMKALANLAPRPGANDGRGPQCRRQGDPQMVITPNNCDAGTIRVGCEDWTRINVTIPAGATVIVKAETTVPMKAGALINIASDPEIRWMQIKGASSVSTGVRFTGNSTSADWTTADTRDVQVIQLTDVNYYYGTLEFPSSTPLSTAAQLLELHFRNSDAALPRVLSAKVQWLRLSAEELAACMLCNKDAA